MNSLLSPDLVSRRRAVERSYREKGRLVREAVGSGGKEGERKTGSGGGRIWRGERETSSGGGRIWRGENQIASSVVVLSKFIQIPFQLCQDPNM